MNISERDQYLIDKYLRSTLDPPEEVEFNDRLSDNSFQERLNLHSDLLEIMMTDERIATKTLLQSWEKQEEMQQPIVRRLWYAGAAVAALALLLMFLLWPNDNKPEDLFDRYYTHFPDAISQTTRNSSSGELTTSMMLAYNQKKWDQATQLMRAHLQKNPDDYAIGLYYALSLLNEQEVEEAKGQLEIVIRDSSDPDFRSAARWYQALCFVKLNEMKNAKNVLEYMIGQNHYQSDYARELLEKINEN